MSLRAVATKAAFEEIERHRKAGTPIDVVDIADVAVQVAMDTAQAIFVELWSTVATRMDYISCAKPFLKYDVLPAHVAEALRLKLDE